MVLDNCEHLTDACAVLVSKLLAAAPDLRILATSRHVLGVEGEQILSVPPLSTPDTDREVLAGDATHYESVTLFLDRAAAVAPGFEIDDGNRAAVIEICRRLDGIPLAIELAAVWLRVLSPAQILDRLEDRFRLLTSSRRAGPPHQQALAATVGWSFDLCSPAEQLMWARLSVFSGGFDLEAAEEVCCGDGIPREDVLNLIASLVNKSIVVRHHATEHMTAWYRMLESIRQYGAERLADQDQVRALQVRHRDHYRSVAKRFEAEGFGPQQADWFIRLRRESGNLRAALEFCLSERGEAAAALDIAAPIWNFWFAGFLREGYRYLTRALDLATEPTSGRAHGLWAASYLAMFATEFEQNATMLAECTEIAAGLDDDLLQARIKECRGQATLYQGDLPGAIELLEQARREFRALGDPLGEFDTLILLTACTFFLDDPRADEFSRQALALAEHHGAQSSMAYGLLERRHRAVARRRLRSGDPIAAEVSQVVPADARSDRHQLRRPGALLVCRLRRARRGGGSAARRGTGRLADERGEGRRDERLQRVRQTVRGRSARGAGLRRARVRGVRDRVRGGRGVLLRPGRGAGPGRERQGSRRVRPDRRASARCRGTPGA